MRSLKLTLAVALETRGSIVPMYRVSPQLFVTREHIISDNSSTSGPSLSLSLSSSLSLSFSLFLGGSGDVFEL